jgi:hypothetical protein
MRVHCHRERGGGVRVVSVGTCRADLWLAVGCLGPNRAGRMDHHTFQDRVSILSQVSWSTPSRSPLRSFEDSRPENGPVYPSSD